MQNRDQITCCSRRFFPSRSDRAIGKEIDASLFLARASARLLTNLRVRHSGKLHPHSLCIGARTRGLSSASTITQNRGDRHKISHLWCDAEYYR